jgi:hypothetical protein
MPNLPVLDVAIGLAFIYLIMGMMCSAVQEAISTALGQRATFLKQGIQNLLAGQPFSNAFGEQVDLVRKVYDHPMIRTLAKPGQHPSYIPARNFTVALLDVVRESAAARDWGARALKEAITTLPTGEVKRSLTTLVEEAQGDLARIQGNIEQWYDSAMDRVSGWYKRRTQLVMFLIGLGLAIGLNIDTIAVTRALWRDPVARAAVVTQAQDFIAARHPGVGEENAVGESGATPQHAKEVAQGGSAPQPTNVVAESGGLLQAPKAAAASGELSQPMKDLESLQNEFSQLTLPVGWTAAGWEKWQQAPCDERLLIAGLGFIGWLFSAAAASLGAPFWFDALSALLNMRSAGVKPPKAEEKPAAIKPGPPPVAPTTSPQAGPTAQEQVGPQNDFERNFVSADEVRLLQKRLGIAEQSLVGVLDAPTRAALRTRQNQIGLEVTGLLSPYLLRVLRGDGPT